MTDQQSSRSTAQHCAEERLLVDPDLFDSCTDISIFNCFQHRRLPQLPEADPVAAAQWHHSGGSQGPAHVCTRHGSIQFFVASRVSSECDLSLPWPCSNFRTFRLQSADFWKRCLQLIDYVPCNSSHACDQLESFAGIPDSTEQEEPALALVPPKSI